MRLLDVNVLLYAVFDAFPQHRKAAKWLEDRLNDEAEKVGFPWETITGFMRIATNPRIVNPPMKMDDALAQVERWLSSPVAWIPRPTDRHMEYFKRFVSLPEVGSKLVADAHLAALAAEHGLVLVSADRDFERFPLIRIERPE